MKEEEEKVFTHQIHPSVMSSSHQMKLSSFIIIILLTHSLIAVDSSRKHFAIICDARYAQKTSHLMKINSFRHQHLFNFDNEKSKMLLEFL